MISSDMARKIARRQFDTHGEKSSRARRLLPVDIERIHQLADEGHDPVTIADRIGATRGSVVYRLNRRAVVQP